MKWASTIAGVVVCALAGQGLALAQAPARTTTAPTEYIQVITTHVEPEDMADFEAFVKQAVAAAGTAGAPQQIAVYQAVMGAPLGTYLVVSGFNKWDEVDRWLSTGAMLSKAHGQDEGMKVLQAGRASIESSQTDVYRLRPNLSTNPQSVVPPKNFVAVTRTELVPGMAAAYEELIMRIRKAEEARPGSPTVLRRGIVLGPAAVVLASRYFDTWAEYGGFPDQPAMMREVFGEADARQMNETIGKAVAHRDLWVLAYRADLSKPAAAPAR